MSDFRFLTSFFCIFLSLIYVCILKISIYKTCNCTLKMRFSYAIINYWYSLFNVLLLCLCMLKFLTHLHFTLNLFFSQRFWKIFFKMMSDVKRRMSEVRFTVGGRYPQSPAIKIEYKKT